MMALHPDKEWWTAREIADAKLPGMPASQQNVEAMAKRCNWREHPEFSRKRRGKGGGWEYHWRLFPQAAQRKLLKEARLATDGLADPKTEEIDLQAYYETLPEKVKAKARHRLNVLQSVIAQERGGLTRYAAVVYTARDHGLSQRTIWNWFCPCRPP